MDRIPVKICAGTTCYVMGGSELNDLPQRLPPPWRDRVQVSGEVCLDLCRQTQGRKPPFVQVGDQIVDQASVEKVLAVLRGLLG